MSVGPREVRGDGGGSGILLNSSIPTQGCQTITFLAFEATTSVMVITSTSMNITQVVTTTATTLTILTTTATLSSTPTISPSPASQDGIPLIHDTVIVASILGGFTIVLISILALIYYLYKRRKQHRALDSPPFTSLAPPPRSAFPPHSMRSSPIPPEDQRETSLSMGPGIHTSEPTQRHSNGTAQPTQPTPDRDSVSPVQNLPAILLQPSSPTPTGTPPARARAQSRLYHDLLREETEIDAARRHGRLDAPGPNTLRPVSGLSDISDMDPGQLLRPSGEGERARGFPSTRASSGVFPGD
jgi:hypothetical protein